MGQTLINMLLNRGLTPNEERRLQVADTSIANTLIASGITARCGFAACGERGGRILKLVAWPEGVRVFMELSPAKLMQISDLTLLEGLEKCLASGNCAAG